MTAWVYRQDQELPSFAVNWYQKIAGVDTLIDFSTGYTFQLLLVNTTDGTIALTKTTNITGAATSPNVTAAWAAGELNLTPGNYLAHLKATTGTSDRIFNPGRPPTITITATPT
jgi:hypothetical protein